MTDLFKSSVHDPYFLSCKLGLSAEVLESHRPMFGQAARLHFEEDIVHGAIWRRRHPGFFSSLSHLEFKTITLIKNWVKIFLIYNLNFHYRCKIDSNFWTNKIYYKNQVYTQRFDSTDWLLFFKNLFFQKTVNHLSFSSLMISIYYCRGRYYKISFFG